VKLQGLPGHKLYVASDVLVQEQQRQFFPHGRVTNASSISFRFRVRWVAFTLESLLRLPSEFDFGLCRCQGWGLTLPSVFVPHGKAVVVGTEFTCPLQVLSTGRRVLIGKVWPRRLRRSIALRGVGAKKEAFKYKKEEWLKCLKFLDPKRQFQTVNRHDRSAHRQNLLALLSFVCHAPVCLVTELEHDYDA
jgi:hypothetical protein